MSLDLTITNDKSTLAQVMAWCPQAISHYMSQCYPTMLTQISAYHGMDHWDTQIWNVCKCLENTFSFTSIAVSIILWNQINLYFKVKLTSPRAPRGTSSDPSDSGPDSSPWTCARDVDGCPCPWLPSPVLAFFAACVKENRDGWNINKNYSQQLMVRDPIFY